MTGHDAHWTFGNQAHIHFHLGDPVVSTPHGFNSSEGCATVSDSNGNLLFYTDGQRLYDAANTIINPGPQPTLGGTSSSSHAAIVVPPAGVGSVFHIFATGDWDGSGANIGPLTHTAVAVVGGAVTIASGPTKLTAFGPQRASERLAAVPHQDGSKYWVVSLGLDPPSSGGQRLYAMLIEGNAGPSGAPGKIVIQTYPYAPVQHFCVKFSPDGSLIAFANSSGTIDILNFDRATGAFSAHSQITGCTGNDRPYGVEFSPNGKYLYFTGYLDGYIRRHTIVSTATTAFASTTLIAQFVPPGPTQDNYRAGALQLAPNGKIYGAKVSQNGLFEIGDPDSIDPASVSSVQFKMIATTSGGAPLDLNATCLLGLPSFTRFTVDRCKTLALAIDEQLAGTPKVNALRPCDDRQPVEQPRCLPVDLPRIAPWTSVRWGDSECDCIEGDDTEVMNLTVCNPYRNLTLSDLTIHQILVVQASGAPVPSLPDGTPSVQLVPAGPHCFDDLAACACVTRQFVLRLRGAVPGPYRILLRGICFEACFHGDEEDCFTFEVCQD